MEQLAKLKVGLFRHWKDVKTNWRNTDDPMKLGLAWSKAFVALLFVLAFVPYSSGGAGWEFKFWTLIKSPPNEIGDTLAGIAGALAFLWIIVTVQLQATELREQREEFKRIAEAQGQQSAILVEAHVAQVADAKRSILRARLLDCFSNTQIIIREDGSHLEVNLMNLAQSRAHSGTEVQKADVGKLLEWLVTSLEALVDGQLSFEGPHIQEAHHALVEYLEVLLKTGPAYEDRSTYEKTRSILDRLNKILEEAPNETPH